MIKFPYYIYLHQNGSMITKAAVVVETGTTPREYFSGPFVLKWWKVEKMEDLPAIIEEAAAIKEARNKE